MAMRRRLHARGASPECRELLLALLEPRQAKRPSPRKALTYAWFQTPA